MISVNNTMFNKVSYNVLDVFVPSKIKQIVVVTGYSGAGKRTFLHALEDEGFYCIDNLPVRLCDDLLMQIDRGELRCERLAFGIDARTIGDDPSLVKYIVQLKKRYSALVAVVFVSCSVIVLLRRYQETRRKHPFGDILSIEEAIKHEYSLMASLRDYSDVVISTDELTVHQLRYIITTLFKQDCVERQLVVQVTSFGFKYGVPTEYNFVFDVRSLPNPYFLPELRDLTGENEAVMEYLFTNPVVVLYWQHLFTFISHAIEQSYREGRYHISMAIGCTGGQHRSVAFVNKLVNQVLPNTKWILFHRDISRHI